MTPHLQEYALNSEGVKRNLNKTEVVFPSQKALHESYKIKLQKGGAKQRLLLMPD